MPRDRTRISHVILPRRTEKDLKELATQTLKGMKVGTPVFDDQLATQLQSIEEGSEDAHDSSRGKVTCIAIMHEAAGYSQLHVYSQVAMCVYIGRLLNYFSIRVSNMQQLLLQSCITKTETMIYYNIITLIDLY